MSDKRYPTPPATKCPNCDSVWTIDDGQDENYWYYLCDDCDDQYKIRYSDTDISLNGDDGNLGSDDHFGELDPSDYPGS